MDGRTPDMIAMRVMRMHAIEDQGSPALYKEEGKRENLEKGMPLWAKKSM